MVEALGRMGKDTQLRRSTEHDVLAIFVRECLRAAKVVNGEDKGPEGMGIGL